MQCNPMGARRGRRRPVLNWAAAGSCTSPCCPVVPSSSATASLSLPSHYHHPRAAAAKDATHHPVGCGHWPLPVWRWWRTRRGAGVGVRWCLCLAALNFDRWAGTLTLVEWLVVKVKPRQGGSWIPIHGAGWEVGGCCFGSSARCRGVSSALWPLS